MEGRGSDAQTAGLLIALRAKGETVEEIAELATPVESQHPDLVDTAGTGGGRPTFNVSTTAAFVAAGAGVRMAKHGNRSSTGRSGSADVLEALGARIDLSPDAVATCIDEIGFGFMFAPAHHPAMKYVVPVRAELAVRTIFNFLGPLTNPAGATRQLIGVSERRFVDIVAAALGELGADQALVVTSDDSLDELSVSGVTRVVELREGKIETYDVTPESVGLKRSGKDDVRAGTPEANAAIARSVLAGEPGADRDLTALNAGAAIYVGGGAESLEAGVRSAEGAIDSGAANETMERFVARTQELAP
jgi:anthranilate phosphoribosyltransferase